MGLIYYAINLYSQGQFLLLKTKTYLVYKLLNLQQSMLLQA